MTSVLNNIACAYFIIHYCQELNVKDFIVKTEDITRKKRGKRVYLNDAKIKDMMKELNTFFESYVLIPRICVGNKQTLETLINEGALLFAKYLRHEYPKWNPRIIER